VLVNGLAALGHLSVRDGRYENSPEAQAFLAGRTSVDMRAGLRLYDQLIYPMWMQLEKVIRSGEPARPGQSSEQFARIFTEGVEAWTRPGAIALAKQYDFDRHQRLLDIGGGTGSYLIPILERHAGLRCTLFELSATIDQAEKRLGKEPTRERVVLVEGDALFDPLPAGHDAVLMAGFVHLFDPERIVRLLERTREVVAPGARLLIVDQWMDSTHTQPAFGALLAGTYLILSGNSRTYSVEEAQRWLGVSGWSFLEHRPLARATSVVIAEAR
jgi:ubiquinone/menaquinone biosynthesis C-methylase UbiE